MGLGAALLLTNLAQAQPGRPGPPGGPGEPGAPGAAPAAAGGAATVTNENTFASTSTTTSDSGLDYGVETSALPKTGGEPLLLTLLGSLTAGGALLLRRKLS